MSLVHIEPSSQRAKNLTSGPQIKYFIFFEPSRLQEFQLSIFYFLTNIVGHYSGQWDTTVGHTKTETQYTHWDSHSVGHITNTGYLLRIFYILKFEFVTLQR